MKSPWEVTWRWGRLQPPSWAAAPRPSGRRGDHSVFFWWPSPFEGCSAEWLFWLRPVGSGHRSVPSSRRRGAWCGWACPDAGASYEMCKDVRRAVTLQKGALGRAGIGERSSSTKSVIEAGLPWLVLNRRRKQATSSGVGDRGWRQGESTLPCHFAFSWRIAWSGRTDLEPSLHLIIRMLQLHFFAFFFTFFPFPT